MICPFCQENDFDEIGLKGHLAHGDCEKYNKLPILFRGMNINSVSKLTIKHEKMKELLRWIAYPRRGTDEEYSDIFDAAKDIQANFKLEDLENEI